MFARRRQCLALTGYRVERGSMNDSRYTPVGPARNIRHTVNRNRPSKLNVYRLRGYACFEYFHCPGTHHQFGSGAVGGYKSLCISFRQLTCQPALTEN